MPSMRPGTPVPSRCRSSAQPTANPDSESGRYREGAKAVPAALFQQPQWMQAVDRTDERWVDAVAEHATNVVGDRSGDLPRHRQGEGLHRSQPRLAVLRSDGKPVAGGGVGSSAMPK